MTAQELSVLRMTVLHMDAKHRQEIRKDVEARWPVTVAHIDAEYERRAAA